MATRARRDLYNRRLDEDGTEGEWAVPPPKKDRQTTLDDESEKP